MFKKNLKRVLTIALAATMVIGSMAGCGKGEEENVIPTPTPTTAPAVENTDPGTTTPDTPDTPATPDTPVAEDNGLEFSVDYAANKVDVGSTTATLGEVGGAGEVGYDVYAGVAGKDYTDPAVYTYRDYIAGTTDMKWSTHTWETNDDSYVLDFITKGFYDFKLNSTGDGWSVVPEMAAELPVDVTADYVGQYGIKEGDTAKAWKIALNPLACWEDGTPINADSYMYSYKELLDPTMKNRRADSLYAGDFVIYNAKEYFYQGSTSYNDNGINNMYGIDALVKGDDGVYYTADGNKMYIAYGMPLAWCSGDTLANYVAAYGETYFDVTNHEALVALMDANGLIPLTDENYALFLPVVTGNPAWGETEADAFNYFAEEVAYADGLDFSNVGIVKTGEYEIVMVTVSPVDTPNYYVPYNLSSSYLVYEPMWEECKSFFDADGNKVDRDADNIVLITTTYCTTADKTMSYGPYKMTYFELDKQITFERNENWHGYKDGKHAGQYQTDIISCQVIGEHDTALLAFLNGEIDGISLDSDDMETYGSSKYIRYTPQSYTTKMTWNTNLDSLTSRGTQVITNPNFRKAFAFALDRQTFASAYTAAGSAGYGLLNYMYLYDPLSGAAYRNTDGAKRALVELYEIPYGPDQDYFDLDEAYDAITGYDMAYAQKLMAQAYDEVTSAGLWDGTTNVEISLSVYQNDDVYVQMFNFFQDALAAAVKGTGFEGKVKFKMVVDADYYNTMYAGGTDMIFSTWGGAASSPYTMLYQCYCDSASGEGNQMEFGFETDKIAVTMNINGKQYTAPLQTWALWTNNDVATVIKSDDGTEELAPFANYDVETKADLFGRLEYAYLCFFTTTPMYYRNVASLVSQKGDYAISDYVDLIGFGGLAFYTYTYNDTEWAEVVKNGLTY